MNELGNLTSSDLKLLSAYLDGECTKRQAARLESRLQAEPELRRALEELRATAGLLRSLPAVQPPRSFALTPEMVGSRKKQSYPVLRLATALASIAFVALVGIDALSSRLVPLAGSYAPVQEIVEVEQPAMEPEMALAPPEDASERNAHVEPEVEVEAPMGGGGLPEPTAQLPAAPAEGVGPTEGFLDQEGIEGDTTPKAPPKGKSVETPELVPGDAVPLPTHSLGDEVLDRPDRIPDQPSGILTWPVWLIALRGIEVALGGAVIVLATFMIRARRK
ncbi:MAG TPA: hypothetical protein G4O08_03270 [Anaerolineae bacterium]|nr:hypothetical protein [Anaerolineae bacterium]